MRIFSLILAGCAVTAFTQAGAHPAIDLADWSASFDSEVHPGMHGELIARETADQTEVTLKLTGAPPDSTLPWHIHEGKCGPGEIVGGADAYTPMVPAADSSATSTATLPLVLDETKDYHVNVHASPTDMGTIVACGDLTR
jgi:hypothetical protein